MRGKIVGAGLAAAGLTLGLGSAAGAANVPIIRFDASSVTVDLPTVGPDFCPIGPNCDWTVFANEPTTGTVVVDEAITSDPFTFALPDYCGNVQVDVSLNGQRVKYSTKQVDTCSPPTTTTTSTTISTVPPVATSGTPGPTVSAPSPTPSSVPAVSTGGSSAPPAPAASAPGEVQAGGPFLAYTGAHVWQLGVLGGVLTALGSFLVRFRRRSA